MIPKVGKYVKVLEDIGFDFGDIEVKKGAIGEILEVNFVPHSGALLSCFIIVSIPAIDRPVSHNQTFLKINWSLHKDNLTVFEGDPTTIKILFES
jgi:hypothetical protein